MQARRDDPEELIAQLRAENAELCQQQAAAAREYARLLDEAQALQAVAAELASARDLPALLSGIVERTMAALDVDGVGVWLLDEETGELHVAASRGLSDQFLRTLLPRPLRPSPTTLPVFSDLRRTRRPVLFRNAPEEMRAVSPVLADALAREGIVSAVRLPLFAPGGEVMGMVSLHHRRERLYGEAEVRLAQAFANQIAIALHNARLTEHERRAREEAQALQAAAADRARELAALLEVARSLTSTLELAPLLDLILDQLRRVMDYRTAGIFLARDDALETVASRDTRGESRRRWYPGHRRPLSQVAGIWQRLLRGELLLIGDLHRDDDPLVGTWRTATSSFRPDLLPSPVRTWMAVPLSVQGKVVGYLALTREAPHSFTARDTELAVAFAGHAAVAIDNARLYAESRELAALEERARLARDLHDSATQSVFSAGMLAHAAVLQHERGNATVGETLARVQAVLGDALRELRALLYELQPTALADEGLATALEKLAAAAQVRTDAAVRYEGAPVPRLAPEAEIAVFRIVQEALGNAVKYARATSIRLTLAEESGRLVAVVVDDGAGFDPAAPVAPSADGRRGGMGLRSMHERAAAAGLHLTVASEPGRGTRVTVEAPLPPAVPAPA